MADHENKINQLFFRLETLMRKQQEFSREINILHSEINALKKAGPMPEAQREEIKEEVPAFVKTEEIKNEPVYVDYQTYQPPPVKKPPYRPESAGNPEKIKSDLEKFIGENLINKIGILITIIGVGIGSKYAIDHQLVSPLTRIILGYLVGTGLLAFAIRLKKNYENFSAVLLSGSMAIMYLITFFAYSFYELIPQVLAFALMVAFTAFTVAAAIYYNMQVIAHIGLVGAYAVPFLLSDGSGRVAILYSYMAIINIGILIISFKKYWKTLYYSSFGLTWLIYIAWQVNSYRSSEHFGLALTFISIFFAIFYATTIAYKLLQKEKFAIDDIILLLMNAFIFYGLGYLVLNGHQTGKQLLGLFTLGNALIHFIVSAIIYKQKLADKNLFYLISGLVLVFITIAVPVQLDGNWVTLLWAGEAALLFWIGRTKQVPVYEILSYPLMVLAFFSILQDWGSLYGSYRYDKPETRITPLLNINFLSSLLFIAAFSFINFFNRKKEYISVLDSKKDFSKIFSFSAGLILVLSIYLTFKSEISSYWSQRYADSTLIIKNDEQGYPDYYWNFDLSRFETIWVLNYTLLFLTVLSFVNFRKLKYRQLGFINLGLNTLVLVIFLIEGLYVLSELRVTYLNQTLSEYYHRDAFNLWIRYISLAFVAGILVAIYKYTRQEFINYDFKMPFDMLLHTTMVWIASSELISWMDIGGSDLSYKLGLSILWGSYSLMLIAVGIWKKKRHLRVGAIALFAVTLIKLFFYDISHLGTIAKTIVFVSLGVLLLIISFLYNKYKHIIADEPAK